MKEEKDEMYAVKDKLKNTWQWQIKKKPCIRETAVLDDDGPRIFYKNSKKAGS